jgi:hypothetical protein
MGIRFDFGDLNSGLSDFEKKVNSAILMYADTAALKLQDHAKVHAPWTDQTGNARRNLKGFTETFPEKTRVGVKLDVDYGVFLELGMEKRYATLAPTINNMSQEVFNGFDRLLDRLK